MPSYYNFQEIATYILEVDREELRRLRQLCTIREQTLNAEEAYVKLHMLYVGDWVKLHDDLSPKKICGKEGRITDVKHEEEKFLIYIPDLSTSYWVKAHHFDKN